MAELSYPVAAGLTLAVELPVYAVALWRWGGASVARAVSIGVVVNVASHPTLWFVLVPVVRSLSGSHTVAVAVAEAIVWLGEGVAATLLLPGRRRWPVGLSTAVAANALSFGVGVALYP